MNPKHLFLLLFATASTAWAGSPFDIPQTQAAAVRPRPLPPVSSVAAAFPDEFRSIDGSGNNPIDPLRGSVSIPLLRMVKVDYENDPAGLLRRSAREISNLVVAQDHMVPSPSRASDYLWQWGQFIDHDMDLTTAASPDEIMNIHVPLGDPFFDPKGTGTQWIGMDRSFYTIVNGVRQQMNVDTAFLDASQVYGSDQARAMELRTLDGTGRLKTSAGDLLPYNVHGFPNAPSTDPSFFLAGDVRANEQVGLTAMHTLFMREHNYWAGVIHGNEPALDDEGIYQRARAIVGAEIQAITYRDFIPALLGPNALPPYTGYHPEVDPSIANIFSTAAFRVGHTMLSPTLLRLDENNQSIGDLSLADSFFNPTQISGPGIEPYLRGLAKQVDQEVDCYLVDGVRNFLFGPPGAGGFDLASLHIQRGRDSGLPRPPPA
ncbi:MAG: peroxidase family protein, partial [Chthoniobacterales bacterium]